MPNYDLGTAHGKVVIDYDGTGADKAKKDIDGIKSKGMSAGAAADRLGTGFTRAGLVVAAGVGIAIKVTADFEKRLSGIAAVSGATGAQMEQLRQKALQLGRDTAFSASDAASAMEELAKAGVALPDILNGAADATVALAAAGGIDLPQAATIAANAMNQFQLSAQNLPTVANLIAGAANASAIDVGDFGQSLAQVGAVAHSAGIPFAETAVAIAELGQAGVKGSDAGTSLKQALIQLANPTKQARDLMQQIGFNAYDSQGRLKSLADISQNLQTSLQNLSPQARQAALSIIFGSDAARVGAIFAQQGATGFNNMAQAMFKVKAADVAKKRMDNLNGSIEQLKGSLETAMIQFGESRQGPLIQFINTLTSLINKFSSLPGSTQQAIGATVAAMGGLALAGGILIKTTRYVQELIKVLEALRVIKGIQATFGALATGLDLVNLSLLRFAANPIVLIIAAIIVAIALLVIGVIELWKHSETFRKIVTGAFNAFLVAVKAVAAVFVAIWHGIVAGFNAIIGALRSTAGFWNAIWDGFTFVVRAVFAAVMTIVRVGMAIINTIISGAMVAIRALWNVWLFFAPIVQAVLNLVKQIILFFFAAVRLVFTVILVILYQLWRAFWASLTAIVQTVITAVMAIVRGFMAVLHAIISGGLFAARALWNAIWSGLTTVVRGVMVAVHALINSWLMQKVIGAIRSFLSWVGSGFSKLWQVATLVGSVFRSMYNTVVAWIGRILSPIRQIAGIVSNAFRNAGRWLINAGRNIIVGLINGIASYIGRLRGYLNSITSWISQWKGPPAKDRVLLKPAGGNIMAGLMAGIREQVPHLEALLSSIGPVNIAPALATSSAVQPILASVQTAGTAAQANATAARTAPAPLDEDALARALRKAGVGETYLDGEKISQNQSRITGRQTRQRGRVG